MVADAWRRAVPTHVFASTQTLRLGRLAASHPSLAGLVSPPLTLWEWIAPLRGLAAASLIRGCKNCYLDSEVQEVNGLRTVGEGCK